MFARHVNLQLKPNVAKEFPVVFEKEILPLLRQLDAALDSSKSSPLWLADPEFADYAEYPIWRGADLGRYDLHAYVVMPNHVHLLLDPHLPLAKTPASSKVSPHVISMLD
jgi:hypothetical protein